MPLPARGVRVGGRVVVIRNGRFVGKTQKKRRLATVNADRKEPRSASVKSGRSDC
jgi:hypothetical protein